MYSLFRNKRFMCDEMTWQNTSKLARAAVIIENTKVAQKEKGTNNLVG